MKNITKRIMATVLMVALCIGIVGTIDTKPAQAATTYMTRYDFIANLVATLKNKTTAKDSSFAGKKITLNSYDSGKITVAGKTVSATKVKAYKVRFNVTLKEAQVIAAAITLGLMKSTTFTSVKSSVLRKDAAVMLAKAEELLYGKKYSAEDVDFVVKNRISDIKKITNSTNKKWFAKAYMAGYMKGTSTGAYSTTRTFKPGAKLSVSTAKNMITLLTSTSKRYPLSPDWQVCRTTKLPRNAELYPYIIDSIPNGYYETGFNGFGTKDFFTTGIGTRTVSEMLSAQYGGDWLRPAYIAEFNALEYPWKDKSFIRIGREYMPENRNNDIVKGLVESSVEFYTYALNVNYKTIKKDKEWRSVMSKYLTDAQIDEYIEHCIENKTIIECDNVGADVSGVYWFEGAYDCKVYAHVRFVSDIPLENKKDNDNEYGTLFPIRRGHILGDRYSRLLLFGYMDYEMGTWIDYYFNTEADPDGPGYLDTSLTTIYDIMINQSGAYPWLLKFD